MTTPDALREAVARIIDPDIMSDLACDALGISEVYRPVLRNKLLTKADAILALTTTPLAGLQDAGASVPDQALAVPVEPASGLAPSGFDPSRGVPNALFQAVGSLVSLCADQRDVFPDSTTAIEVITDTVNELYGCLEGGVFGQIAADPFPLAEEAFHEALKRYPDSHGALIFLWYASGHGHGEITEDVLAWARLKASGIEARSDETLQAAHPKGQEPVPEATPDTCATPSNIGDAEAREVLAIATEKCGYTLAATAIRRGQDDQPIKAHIALAAIRGLKSPPLTGAE